jgi:uroporphyrinogen-III synthase
MMEYMALPADAGDISAYQAIVFTSAQAVQFFSGHPEAYHLPVLAVGDATAAAARKAGYKTVYSAKGNSINVSELIKAETPELELKRVLHPCSDDTAGDIGAAVAAMGVEVVRLPVYKAEFLNSLPEDVTAALRRGAIDVVTVFSARTAENFVRLMLKQDLRGVSARLEAVCISENVATTLKELPWRVVHIARQPRLEAVMEALREKTADQISEARERRAGLDRRKKAASRDMRGYIQADSYTGPERRRMHKRRQQDRILQEKLKFVSRTSLTFAFMFMAIVLAGVFLMGPEYARLNTKPEWVDRLEGWVKPLWPKTSWGILMNRGIGEVQQAADPYTDAVGQITSSAADAMQNPAALNISRVLDNVGALRSASGDDVTRAMNTLRLLLSDSTDHPENFNRSVAAARQKDKTLDTMLGPVRGEDMAAGALLLVLNEFRSNVDNHRPYAQDLALLQKLSGNDPRMNQALRRLAPYAEKGVMSRQALQMEMKGLAADIITAKLQGRDVSVKEDALQRFEKLSQVRQADEIKGADEEAVVARARLLLDQGDVKGAMRELQSLEGASAQEAAPWMEEASGTVAADEASSDLTQALLQGISGNGGFSAEDLVRVFKEHLRGPDVPYLSPSLKNGADGGKDVLAPAGP